MWDAFIAFADALQPYRDLMEVFVGAIISGLVSKWLAQKYFDKQFRKQAEIDKARAKIELDISYGKVVGALIRDIYRRETKVGSTQLHEANYELMKKIEIYNPELNAKDESLKLTQRAFEDATRIVRENADDFRDVPRSE